MKWARNHIILKTKNFEYNIRGNEKFVKLVGVLFRNILEFLNGSTFL